MAFRASKRTYVEIIAKASLACLTLLVLGIFVPETAILSGAGMALVIAGAFLLCEAYVTLYPDHFQTRLTPANNWHTVLYSEVTHVERKGKILNIYYKKLKAAKRAKPRRIELRLYEFDEEEQTRFIEAFNARLYESSLPIEDEQDEHGEHDEHDEHGEHGEDSQVVSVVSEEDGGEGATEEVILSA